MRTASRYRETSRRTHLAKSVATETATGVGKRQRLFLKDGPRLGHIRVELLDDSVILLFHDAAAQLEREGQAAVVESKILGQQCETLDAFILCEIGRK